jgi:hypothetical protein
MLTCLAVALAVANCDSDHVTKNNPAIELKNAIEIGSIIRKYSTEFNIPFQVMSAIAMTESSYRLNVKNQNSNDYGIFQINQENINYYKFDKQKLLNDLDYSIKSGFIVFNWFYNQYPLNEAIKRYNCGTSKDCINWKVVKNYLTKVQGYL